MPPHTEASLQELTKDHNVRFKAKGERDTETCTIYQVHVVIAS